MSSAKLSSRATIEKFKKESAVFALNGALILNGGSMETTKLCAYDPEISRLTLGTMMFGKTVDSAQADRIVGLALDAGINSIDTAGTYNNGRSEVMTGKALAERRSKVILASKVGYPLTGGIESVDLSEKAVISETEAALKRLGTDYLDILYLHAPDRSVPIGETLAAADKLVRSGKVRYLGVSNYSAWELTELLWVSEREKLAPISVTQNIYNVLSRRVEAELALCVKHFGLGMTVYNPLAGGILTGKYSGSEATSGRLSWNAMYKERFLNEANLDAVRQLGDIARENSMSLIELSYRWCLSRDFVSSMLIGVSSYEQLEANLKCCKFEKLSADILECCEKQWQVLRGVSPDYAR